MLDTCTLSVSDLLSVSAHAASMDNDRPDELQAALTASFMGFSLPMRCPGVCLDQSCISPSCVCCYGLAARKVKKCWGCWFRTNLIRISKDSLVLETKHEISKASSMVAITPDNASSNGPRVPHSGKIHHLYTHWIALQGSQQCAQRNQRQRA